MRKTTLDQLAECKWELEEVKTEAQEYKLYKKIITKLFPRQHERIVDEIKKQAIKNKLGLVYTITGESPLNKLYTKHMDMEVCEKSVKSYVINLNKNKYKNLDWIS